MAKIVAMDSVREKQAKDMIDTVVSDMEKAEPNSGETQAKANSRVKQAEIDKNIDAVTQKSEKAAAFSKAFMQKSQDVVRMQAQFNNSNDKDDREDIKNRVLASGILALEDIDAALATLRSARADILTRLNSTFDWARKDVNQVVKERQFPKAQFELELNLNRNLVDSMHRACESNGAPRREHEATNNGKTKKAA